MKSTVLNEINNMKYLFNYDRSKTINEQQEVLKLTWLTAEDRNLVASLAVIKDGKAQIQIPGEKGMQAVEYLTRDQIEKLKKETPVPTPPATGSTVGSGPIPSPADGESSRPLPPPVTPPAPADGEVSTPGPLISPKEPITAQSSSISAPTPGGSGDPYQYKFEDDGTTQKYYYAKKGQNNWKQSTNPKSVEAIKKNIFKIR